MSGEDRDGSSDTREECIGNCIGDVATQLTGCSEETWQALVDNGDRSFEAMTEVDGECQAADAVVIPCADPMGLGCDGKSGIVVKPPSDARAVALAYKSVKGASVEISGSVLSVETGNQATVRVFRNSLEDVLWERNFVSSTAPVEITLEADILENDRIIVSLQQFGGEPQEYQVALRIVKVPDLFPGECELALPFLNINEQTTEDACRSRIYTQRDSNRDPQPLTPISDGPVQGPGQALRLPHANYLAPSGIVLDSTSDFTLQLWVRFYAWQTDENENQGYLFSTQGVSDLNLGFWLYYNRDEDSVLIDGIVSARQETFTLLRASSSISDDSDWHFLRLVRDTSKSELRLCIDGVIAGSTSVPGDWDLDSDGTPHVGLPPGASTGGATTQADIADLRYFTKPLPCE